MRDKYLGRMARILYLHLANYYLINFYCVGKGSNVNTINVAAMTNLIYLELNFKTCGVFVLKVMDDLNI